MGRGKRKIPSQMPNKLGLIRTELNFNLEEMTIAISKVLRSLDSSDIKVFRSHILEFEKGQREPQLPVLLAYSQLANVYVEVLISDDLELPKKLPVNKRKVFE